MREVCFCEEAHFSFFIYRPNFGQKIFRGNVRECLNLNEGNILSTKFSRRERRFRRFAINTHYFVIIYPYPHAKICAICVICERFHTPYTYSRRVRSPILATAVPDMAGQTWKYLFLTIQSGGATDQIFRAVSERILRFEEGAMRAS